jgi:hypothetical protein
VARVNKNVLEAESRVVAAESAYSTIIRSRMLSFVGLVCAANESTVVGSNQQEAINTHWSTMAERHRHDAGVGGSES